MRALPPALQRYLVFVYGCAFGILVICAQTAPLFPADLFALILFCTFGIVTELRLVVYRYALGISQTVGAAAFVSAAFILPPFSLLVAVALASAVSDILGHKPWFRVLFNVSYRFIIFGLLGLIINKTNIGAFADLNVVSLLIFVTLFLFYGVLSVVPMGILVALANGQSISFGWRESSKYFNEYDMSLFPYGLILAWLWHANSWYFLIGLLPLLATQRSFATHASLLREQEATERLADQQRRVQEATTLLLSSKDVHSQLDTLLQHLMEVFPIIRGSVSIWGAGSEPDQVVSRGADELVLPIEGWIDHLRHVSESRRVVQLDHEYTTRATGGRPVVLVPLVTSDQNVGCLVLVVDDPVALEGEGERLLETFAAQAALAIYQARLIDQLKSSQVRVVQSERLAAIGTLAAGVAHEFNNLLAGISGIAQLALLEDDHEEQRTALDTVVKASQQGGSITRGLLTFARHLEPKRELADIYTAIDPVLAMMQAEFRHANITVIRQLEPVPLLVCDIGMLAQVVLNLVTNAIDAMHPQGGVLTISLAEQQGEMRLSVSDTGCGIPEHVRDKIFEPFVSTKASTDGKLHGGTGLGLAITYGIVTDHGGIIDVESQPFIGTTMTVRLPIIAPDDDLDGSEIMRQNQPLRMIVVDDEPMIAKSLHGLLTREGHVAHWFTEPQQALAAIDSGRVDVIFADLMMPHMDGITLLQQVKQRAPHATQVVVTSQSDGLQLERARALGVYAVIEKPFSIDAIRAIVDEARAVHLPIAA